MAETDVDEVSKRLELLSNTALLKKEVLDRKESGELGNKTAAVPHFFRPESSPLPPRRSPPEDDASADQRGETSPIPNSAASSPDRESPSSRHQDFTGYGTYMPPAPYYPFGESGIDSSIRHPGSGPAYASHYMFTPAGVYSAAHPACSTASIQTHSTIFKKENVPLGGYPSQNSVAARFGTRFPLDMRRAGILEDAHYPDRGVDPTFKQEREDEGVSPTSSYESIVRENYHLIEQLKERDYAVSSLQSRLCHLENQINELRQLPIGKITHIPVEDMIKMMEEYGSESSNQTWQQRKSNIKKASIVRQFRRWNPEFFRYFVHVNGGWVPKLGKEGELKRREEKRKLARKKHVG